MIKIAQIVHATLWVALGCHCIWPVFEEAPDHWFPYGELNVGQKHECHANTLTPKDE